MFLAYGTFWFWIFVCIELFAVTISIAKESNKVTLIIVAIFLGLMSYFGDLSFFSYIKENPISSIVFLCGYIVLGGFWALFKWVRLVQKSVMSYNAQILNFLKFRNLTDVSQMTDLQKEECKKTLNASGLSRPLAYMHKSKIVNWWAWWVFSVILYLFEDLICDLFSVLYKFAVVEFQKITDKIWAKKINLD